MDDSSDDERLQTVRDRARRAAEAAADAKARLERHESEAAAAARRLRELLGWWVVRRGADGDRR
ncbi:hypothetical protein E6C67_36945 (plasmid) [Azospirillum sp. TSA2s]|uniref:hypothetical protein n=1 Tax=Azospirillum sp. TSA2s TaxID=709810 RepID=UPI0010AA9295|nr:hypothetical protein [Azospirillum sp. TSA2s]QCG99359.1 hypothetical protein E6C67_36945 [Azospirillum sp. TSA2s]